MIVVAKCKIKDKDYVEGRTYELNIGIAYTGNVVVLAEPFLRTYPTLREFLDNFEVIR